MAKATVGIAGMAGVAACIARARASGARPIFARRYAVLSRRAEHGEVGKRRRALLAHASGRVLDLGVGTGESFKHLPPAVNELVAIDPDQRPPVAWGAILDRG